MRFTCNFFNPDTDERKSIVASLTASECRSIESLLKHKGVDTADLQAQACALRHAYSEVPSGFRHIEPPSLVLAQ